MMHERMSRQDDLTREVEQTSLSAEERAGADIVAGFYATCGIEEPRRRPIDYDALRDAASTEELATYRSL